LCPAIWTASSKEYAQHYEQPVARSMISKKKGFQQQMSMLSQQRSMLSCMD
jgi:hypothetical protein